MRLMVMTLTLGFFLLCSLPADLLAQSGFTDHSREDGVRIVYRWQRSMPAQRDSDAALVLRATNENTFPVQLTLTVGFYQDKVLVLESEPASVCIMPGQTRRGGLAGLMFTATGMKMADVGAENFSWDIVEWEVKQVEGCK